MDTRPHACGYMATWSQRFSSGYLTSRYTCDLICIPLEASSALWPIEQNQTLCTVPIKKKMVEIRLQTFNIGLPHFSQIQIRIPWDQNLFEIICFNGTVDPDLKIISDADPNLAPSKINVKIITFLSTTWIHYHFWIRI
jgi:hypothetical protein